MQKVKPFEQSQSLAEVYNVGFQLAFASEKFEQCHSWVLCKDFLTDALWATFNTEKIKIYGFEYNPADHPLISIDPVRILVRNKELGPQEFGTQIKNSCKFINMLEAKLKFKMAKIEQVSYSAGGSVWMLTLDKRWIHASPMISMLSLFLRIGCYYNGKSRLNEAIRSFKKGVNKPNRHECNEECDEWGCDYYEGEEEAETNDSEYITKSRNLRMLIMQKGLSIFKEKMEDNYPQADIYTIHNDWGIVGAKNDIGFQTLWDLKDIDVVGKSKKKATKKKAKKKAKKKVAKKKAKVTKVYIKKDVGE